MLDRLIRTQKYWFWPLMALYALIAMLLVTCGCIREETRQIVDQTKRSIPSLKPVTPATAHAGLDAMQAGIEQAMRDIKQPREPLPAIDFTQETKGQAGTVALEKATQDLKTKLDNAEATIAFMDKLVVGGLGLLGAKGALLAGLYMAFRKRKKQVGALVEGTQDVLSQLGSLPAQLAGKTPDEILATLGRLPEMAKGIMKEYQDAQGVWQGLKGDIAAAKESWKTGTRAMNMAGLDSVAS